MEYCVPTSSLVLRTFVIRHEMNVRSPEKYSHIFSILSLQPLWKLKWEMVMDNMEERGGRGMPEGETGREEVEGEGESGKEGGERKEEVE